MTSLEGMQLNHNSVHARRGKMIVVCSAKGGVGRTILTVNLSAAIYKKNISVGILDGNFQFGDISLALDLQSAFTIKEVIEGLDTLDEHSLSGYLCRHETGVNVLPAPERPEFADLVDKEGINSVVDIMLTHFDYVFVDAEVGLNDITLNFIEKADEVLVVTNLEMATLKNTKLMLETYEALEMRDKVRVVINRSTMESVIQAKDAANILGEDQPFFIPNDFQICSHSLNIGIPFITGQPKSSVAKAIFKMAEDMTEKSKGNNSGNENSSFISKWIPRKQRKAGKQS